tara:strand:- start:1053 stop:1160 length:108 start_codon:yes stop_codon:yes gene_type:complete
MVEDIVKRGYGAILTIDSLFEVSDKLRGDTVGSVG